jgi:hypothetical protein
MTTLLQIARAAADEIGIPRPPSVSGATDPAQQKLFRYANKVGNRVMKVADWQALRREHVAVAVTGEDQPGILPADFDRFIPETFWNRTTSQLVSGPVTSTEWQNLKASAYNGGAAKFIYRGGAVSILPGVGAGQELAFEYVSRNWIHATEGTPKAAFTQDTDEPVLDDELLIYGMVFEFLQSEGQPFAVAAASYEARFKLLLENDQPTSGVMVAADIFGQGRHFGGAPSADGFAGV